MTMNIDAALAIAETCGGRVAEAIQFLRSRLTDALEAEARANERLCNAQDQLAADPLDNSAFRELIAKAYQNGCIDTATTDARKAATA